MKLAQLVETSEAVRRTRSRKQKIEHLAAALRQLGTGERRPGALYLAGVIPQGTLGVGHAALEAARGVAPAEGAELSVADVDRAFAALAAEGGAGSKKRRQEALGSLLSRATAPEQRFVVGLIAGALRQGASEGLLLEALAAATDIDAGQIRRAAMLAGDLGEVAGAALSGGAAALDAFKVELFRPLAPMLAQPVEDLGGVYDALGDLALELKVDGARIQAHKDEGEVRVYSRGLRDVSAAVPEIVRAVRALPARSAILDGEAIALREDGRPHRFQTTMSRFSRKANHAASSGPPLSSLFFDAVYLEGDSLLDRPALPRGPGAALRPGQALSPRQVARRGRHGGRGPGDLRGRLESAPHDPR